VGVKGLYHRILWALSCSNNSNCAKTRRRPHFDRYSRWIIIIPRSVLLTRCVETWYLNPSTHNSYVGLTVRANRSGIRSRINLSTMYNFYLL